MAQDSLRWMQQSARAKWFIRFARASGDTGEHAGQSEVTAGPIRDRGDNSTRARRARLRVLVGDGLLLSSRVHGRGLVVQGVRPGVCRADQKAVRESTATKRSCGANPLSRDGTRSRHSERAQGDRRNGVHTAQLLSSGRHRLQEHGVCATDVESSAAGGAMAHRRPALSLYKRPD